MNKNIAAIAAFSLALAIVLGAWNAHGMEQYVTDGKMSAKYIKTFYTGVQYEFICSLGLLVLGLAPGTGSGRLMKIGIWCIFTGMVVFSFSLYFVALNEMLGEGLRKLGMITPFGGLLMTAGWLFAGISFLKK